MTFTLDEDEVRKFNEWSTALEARVPAPPSAIGGRYTFRFTRTSIGTFCTVTSACGAEILLTDVSSM